MPDTFAVTGTIFALIGLGYLVARLRILGPEGVRSLGAYVVNLALPALIFRALTERDLAAIISPGYLLGYAAGSLATLALGYLVSRRFQRLPAIQSTFRAMGMSCANSGFMGYPILLMAMPAVAGPALALNMIVENLVVIPLILVMAEAGRDRGAGLASLGAIVLRLLRNPILLGILAGLAVTLADLDLPGTLHRTVGLLAGSSAAVSLVAIGGTLAALPASGAAAGGVATVVAGKLLFHPVAVGLALFAVPAFGLPVSPDLLRAGILMAAMPAMGIYPILAGQYGQGRTAAVAMFAMTVLSFGTVNLLLVLLDRIAA
jgi:malonate transporter and related proteins